MIATAKEAIDRTCALLAPAIRDSGIEASEQAESFSVPYVNSCE
jgi:hypothetical protein